MTDTKMWQLWLASGEQVAVFGRKLIDEHERTKSQQAARATAPSDPWVSAPEALPTKPGNYLAMLVEDNSFGYTSTEPVPVEFDAYTSRPKQFTISDSWSNGPENATDEITFWMRLPTPPSAASEPRDK